VSDGADVRCAGTKGDCSRDWRRRLERPTCRQ